MTISSSNKFSPRILKYARRKGALLLDLFIATSILASCLVFLSDFGVRTLKLAQRNSIERLEIIAAESILAKAIDGQDFGEGKTWTESLHGIPVEIKLIVTTVSPDNLKRFTVHISTTGVSKTNQTAVSLSRLAFLGEGS